MSEGLQPAFPVSDSQTRTRCAEEDCDLDHHPHKCAECPYCGRMVATVNITERGRIMQGHRVVLVGRVSVPKPPWCPGGGCPC